jgi:uncharacterized protein (DUF2267 family)
MFETRKEFLEELAIRAGLRSIEEADRIAQIVIGLIKARISPELSQQIAENVPEDLGRGWSGIAIPGEFMELQEMMFELEEVGQDMETAPEPYPPEYG